MSPRVFKSLLCLLDRITPASRERQPGHLATGSRGEDEAFFYLRDQGYTIVARNWRASRARGEVDLIGWEGDVLCFIEVKTRTTHDVKPAEAAVDRQKQKMLRSMARHYLRRLRSRPQYRFDIVSLYLSRDAEPDVTLFRNAFQ